MTFVNCFQMAAMSHGTYVIIANSERSHSFRYHIVGRPRWLPIASNHHPQTSHPRQEIHVQV